jgi:hypothetical protein
MRGSRVDQDRAEGRSGQVGEPRDNNGTTGLTVSTPAEEYFNRHFDTYREALVTQRDDISKFEPLPDVVMYPSATQTNYNLTTQAPDAIVAVFDKYIEYLDKYKEQVDRAIKEIREQDQA